MRVGDLGERGLLELIGPFCTEQVGDDCALMGAPPVGYEVAISTDMLVEGVHFSPQTTSAYDVGWRGATANLSDLAAVGAQPWGLTVALGLPADTAVEWVLEVYRGLRDCGGRWGVGVVGGDLVRSPVPVLGITAMGQVPIGRSIRRHGARIGDVILVTGLHGLSRGGLALLLQPDLATKLTPSVADYLRQCHQRPDPRLDVAQVVMELTAERNCSIAGMDSSDGLADAILQICSASGVSARLDWEQVIIHPALEVLAGAEAKHWVWYGGEDFQLVLCMPRDIAELVQAQFPDCTQIGEIVSRDDRTANLGMLAHQQSFAHFI